MINKSIFLLFFCVSYSLVSAQEVFKLDQNTILVTGKSDLNLSPNEIIISLSFQEYFNDKEESANQKVSIEVIEKRVRATLEKAGIKKDKITVSGARIIRPYINRIYYKRRINKTLSICIATSDEYINLVRQLESDGLFENDLITSVNISAYRHTEKEKYEVQSHQEALVNAKAKAEQILKGTGRKLGEIRSIREINIRPQQNGSAYSFENNTSEGSGFKPISLGYSLEVIFEID